MSDEAGKPIAICVGIVALLSIILISLSFQKLNYYEIGFLRKRTTGTIFTDTVYGPGNHAVGPDFFFVKWPSTVQSQDLRNVAAATKQTDTGDKDQDNTTTLVGSNSNSGSAVFLDISFQYFIPKDNLKSIKETIGITVDLLQNWVERHSLFAIKNAAITFGPTEYLQSRSTVEQKFREVVKAALANKTFVELTGLQLRRVDFPPAYVNSRLAVAIAEQSALAADYRQSSVAVRSETATKVKEKENLAKKTKEIANGKVILTRINAANNATRIEQETRSEGLKIVAERFNISMCDEKKRASLDYLIALIDNPNVERDLYLNFDGSLTKVVG